MIMFVEPETQSDYNKYCMASTLLILGGLSTIQHSNGDVLSGSLGYGALFMCTAGFYMVIFEW
jgi:hypothetical protein